MNTELLKSYMKDKKVTVKAMAEAMSLSRQSVYSKLKGLVPVTTKDARAIIQLLELTDEQAVELFLKEEK